ncbi:MAG: flippase-like domain-containing protein [Candidatus Aminicenantes bacterium]|nr:flippase-like domain-containing protein [Candidatus Aminicenantes bacterium]
MSRNKLTYIVLSAIVSAVLLLLLFKQIDFGELSLAFSRIFLPALVVYAAVALIAAWLRAWRYKWLLRPQPIGWRNILLVTFIRNSLIDLLPARIGSLSYIYVLNKRLGFPFETATSSFIVAFVLDFLTISPFLFVSLLAVGLGSHAVSTPLLLSIAVAFFLLVGLFYWRITPIARWFLTIFRWCLRFAGLAEKRSARTAAEKFELTIQSLAAIQERGNSIPIFILSLLIRLAKYVSVFALFYAFLKSFGYSLPDLNFWMFILGLSGAELTSALPIKGLAGFGTWESAWALTFQLLSFDPKLAVLSGLGVHFLTNLFEYSLGVAAILILVGPYFWRRRRR